MSLSIQNNYGQVNHIENSNVSINPNGQVVNEGQLRTNEENPNLNVEDVAFEEVPKPEELPTKEQLSKIFTFKYRQDLGFSLLIDFLRSERDRTDFHADSDWARYALTIYEWEPCVLQKRPNTFKEWLPKFCELFGRAWVRDYEPNKLQSTKECKIVLFLPLRETR